MPPLGTPLAHPKFSLDTAGVAGIFGGEEAISAMATIHLYEGRRWLGWYNSPGSQTIAKRFGVIANGRFWDGLFPGKNDPLVVSLGLDGKKGPQYIAPLSGTTLQTGHLGYLTMERSKEVTPVEEIKGLRVTTPNNVTYLAMKNVDYNAPVKLLPFKNALWGLIPIAVSVATCVMCALVYDWFSFFIILVGIIISGLTSFFIGDGRLVIKSVSQPAPGAPSGHGILIEGDEVVVIKGKEQDVNAITRGRFDLTGPKEKSKEGDEREYRAIGVCSLLLLFQFLSQLLLVPKGTPFGQIMFLSSFGASWVYNSYLSSLEKEKIQADLLFKTLGKPEMRRFRTWTRTTTAVFVCLLLFNGVTEPSTPEEDRERSVNILKSCIPNETNVWRQWREKVVDQMLVIDEGSRSSSVRDEGDLNLTEPDKRLLKALLEDAQVAFREYQRIRGSLPVDSTTSHHPPKGDT